MKKFTLIVLALIAFQITNAQYSHLTISTSGNNNLKARFNNENFSFYDRSVTFQRLTPGSYSLIIYQLRSKGGGPSEYVEVYNGSVTLTANKHLEMSVLRFGKVSWDEGEIQYDNWTNNYSNPVKDGNNPGGNNTTYQTTDATQLEKMKKAIKDGYYDRTMLINAKAILKNAYLNVSQITQVVALFSADDSKLDLIKFLYNNCLDKANYFTLGEQLYYPRSKTDLLEFIGSK